MTDSAMSGTDSAYMRQFVGVKRVSAKKATQNGRRSGADGRLGEKKRPASALADYRTRR